VWILRSRRCKFGSFTEHGPRVRRGRNPVRRCEAGLEETLDRPVEVIVHEWTGRNRVLDRWQASDELRAAVRSRRTQRGTAVAIAHSHGGNVVADALEVEPDLFKTVVTLNTPFVTFVSRHQVVLLMHGVLLALSAFILPLVYSIRACLRSGSLACCSLERPAVP
jgi:hypothetical protein